MDVAAVVTSVKVYKSGHPAGTLWVEGHENRPKRWVFEYDASYEGPPVFWTLPTSQQTWVWEEFPAFFDGLLPEGFQLDALLKREKIDRNDYMRQLLAVGKDMVGDVTVLAS